MGQWVKLYCKSVLKLVMLMRALALASLMRIGLFGLIAVQDQPAAAARFYCRRLSPGASLYRSQMGTKAAVVVISSSVTPVFS
jgi:hypothetical protein